MVRLVCGRKAHILAPVKSILLGSLMLGSALVAEAATTVGLQTFVEGLVSPTTLVPLKGTDKLLIGDQTGVIYSVAKSGGAKEQWLDLRPKMAKLNQGFDERGLLGIATHPEFASNGRIFICYSGPLRPGAPAGWDHTMRLSEFKVNDGKVDANSEQLLLDVDKPYFNHNGGVLAFGPDNMLYWGVGDGGNGNGLGRGHSPIGNGQDLNNLLGKILRLDVSAAGKYTAPKDNPLKEDQGRPEIWAWGFRNPWRISFDRGGSKELFVADIGQENYEEVDIVVKGGNYGWNAREGFHPFDPKNPRKTPESGRDADAAGKKFEQPIFEYKNFRSFKNDPDAYGISITGGYVYRGKAIPELDGKYVFGDWSKSFVVPDGVLLVASRGEAGKAWATERLQTKEPFKAFVLAFGEDEEGELYVMTNGSNALMGERGKVYKITAAK